MNELSSRFRVVLWWIAPLAVAVAIVGWETDWGRQVDRHPPAPQLIPPQPVTTTLLTEYSIAGGAAARTETVSRTLFNPTRRPAPALATEGAAGQMPHGQFTLTGTTVIDGKSAAFLREASGKSRRVKAGEMINGMLVAEVRPDRVKLTMNNDSEELLLRVVSNRSATAPFAIAAQPLAQQAARPVAAPVPPQPVVTPQSNGESPDAEQTPEAVVEPQEAQALVERRRTARMANPQPQPVAVVPVAPAVDESAPPPDN